MKTFHHLKNPLCILKNNTDYVSYNWFFVCELGLLLWELLICFFQTIEHWLNLETDSTVCANRKKKLIIFTQRLSLYLFRWIPSELHIPINLLVIKLNDFLFIYHTRYYIHFYQCLYWTLFNHPHLSVFIVQFTVNKCRFLISIDFKVMI